MDRTESDRRGEGCLLAGELPGREDLKKVLAELRRA